MTVAKRPTTCHDMFVTNAELGSEGCRRLPRHGGDHRPFLTLAAMRKAERAKTAKRRPARRVKLTAKARREKMAELATLVESGAMTPSDALSAAAKLV